MLHEFGSEFGSKKFTLLPLFFGLQDINRKVGVQRNGRVVFKHKWLDQH